MRWQESIYMKNPDHKGKLSIICAVYNGGIYFRELLDALLRQTRKDFQLIIVDDGSTDETQCHLEQCKEGFQEIQILCNETNHGVSFSRNRGIERVTGQYLVFLDADDFIEDNFVESIYSGIASCKQEWNILYFEIRKFYNDNLESTRKFKNKNKNTINNKEEIYRNLLDERYLGGYLFNKVFRYSVIQNAKIAFDEDVLISEDELFCLKYIKASRDERAYKINVIYYYRQHSYSTTSRLSIKKILSMLQARDFAAELLKGTDAYKLAIRQAFVAKIYASFYVSERKISKLELVKKIAILLDKHIKLNDKVCYLIYIISYRLAKKIYFRNKMIGE